MNISKTNIRKSLSPGDIASLNHWWSLAGVDLDFAHDPRALLKESSPKLEKSVGGKQNASLAQLQEEPLNFSAQKIFPNDVNDFLEWLSLPKNLIESSWAREFVAPEGVMEPEFMILSAIPEIRTQNSVEQFSIGSQQMVQSIVKALGARLEQCFLIPLSLGRSTDGQIAAGDLAILVERMKHLISLIQPKRIILFGDTVSRAFFDEDLLTARKKKQFINHSSSKTETIVTFHPRILLERPELKAEAWKDLQQLTRIVKP